MKALVMIPVHLDPVVNPFLVRPICGQSPLERTIRFAERLEELEGLSVRVCVVTDDKIITDAVANQEQVFLPQRTEKTLQGALKEGLINSEKHFETIFDIVIVLEPPHAFRPWPLAVEAYELLCDSDELDSVVCVEQLHGRIWAGDGSAQPLADSLSEDFYGAAAPFREVVGLFLITRRNILLSGHRIGESVGLVVVDKKWAFVDIRSEESFQIAEHLADMLES